MDQPTKRGKRGSEKQLDHFNYRDEEDAEAAEPGSWQKADEARRPRHAHAMPTRAPRFPAAFPRALLKPTRVPTRLFVRCSLHRCRVVQSHVARDRRGRPRD